MSESERRSVIMAGNGNDIIYVENATRVFINAGNGNNLIQLGKIKLGRGSKKLDLPSDLRQNTIAQ